MFYIGKSKHQQETENEKAINNPTTSVCCECNESTDRIISKIHLWVDEGDSNNTIPSYLWGKLKDSRIYNKLGSYIYSFKWNVEVEYDYIIYIIPMYISNTNGNTTKMDLFQIRILNGSKELIYRRSIVVTNINNDHITLSVDACYNYVLKWHDEYLK